MSKRAIADVSTAIGKRQDRAGMASRVVPALTIVSHPDPRRAGERLLLEPLVDGRAVALSRNAPDFVRPGHVLGMPLDDPFISRKPVRIAPLPGGRIQITADADGTRVVCDSVVLGKLEIGPKEIEAGVVLELSDRVVLLLHEAELGAASTTDTLGMVGESRGVRQVRAHVERIADLSVPVLIRGETGTGKELVASAIHDRGPRRSGPFIRVNLGAIPKELGAAELFGAHKGAYTGATRDREGFFRAAHGGTLFLDEVGEASTEVQVMLLRVLETGEMYPVGGHSPIAVNVRLIAATDANLEAQIREGRFKAPLLHRLAGYEIRLPALRERREDIGALFYHFAREEAEAIGEAHRLSPQDAYADPWLPASLAARLVRHSWPGNIRQLRNLTRQLVIGSRGKPQLQIDPRLAEELDAVSAPPPAHTPDVRAPEPRGAPRRKGSDVSEEELIEALRDHEWDLKAAADRLGIPRSSIYDLIDKCPNIRTAGDLDAEEIVSCFQECRGDLDAMVRRLEVSKRALSRRIKELGLMRDA